MLLDSVDHKIQLRFCALGSLTEGPLPNCTDGNACLNLRKIRPETKSAVPAGIDTAANFAKRRRLLLGRSSDIRGASTLCRETDPLFELREPRIIVQVSNAGWGNQIGLR